MKRRRALVVDDDASLRRIMQMQLEELELDAAVAPDAPTALALLEHETFPLVITDLRLPGLSGLDLLTEIRGRYPGTTVIMITAFGSVETAVEAMKAGAYDYITKPIDYGALALVIRRAVERDELLQQVKALRATVTEKFGFGTIIGHSRGLTRVLDLAGRAAQSDATVLISGETGTGKELLARAIHLNSARGNKPFITINSGTIPHDLVEAELFGHVKGAFTGAIGHKRGKVELADGGTLFLDEIGELPLDVQVKILRLIQHGEVEKIGSVSNLKVDVRVIAATHRNLQAMVEDGSFREDLFYRLAVIPLELPPLRERRDDIPELVQKLFATAVRKSGRTGLRLPDSLVPMFVNYRWPGNVRELENVIERVVVLARGDVVSREDLPEFLCLEPPDASMLRIDLPENGISLEGVERELIERALRKFNGNQTQAARYLDISRRTLIYRMEKHHIGRDDNPPERD